MPKEPQEVGRTRLEKRVWFVKRIGTVEEVEYDDNTIRFRTQVTDEGRDPFVTVWFNDTTPAFGLLEKIQEDNESYHNIRTQEVNEDGN